MSTSEPAFAEAVGQPSVLTGDMQVTHFQESSGCTGFCREIVCLCGWLSHGFNVAPRCQFGLSETLLEDVNADALC